MPAPTTLEGISATASNNYPTGGEAIGASLDDYLRAYQAVMRGYLANASADVASATTTDIGAAASNYVRVTGTTTITGLGTVSAGIWKFVRFNGALTLTHDGTALILPGATNITTVAGDTALFVSEGSGNWRCIFYAGQQANHTTVKANGGITSKSATAGIGYATGSGGTVTQLTDKSTGVELNTVTGLITTHNAQLNAATIVSFVLTNSAIAATDMLVLTNASGTPGSYTLESACGAGNATIYIRNNTAGNLTEAIGIRFAVIKSVNA